MNYADIKKCDAANGPGIRISLFVSGCTHCCKGCFNREAWDFNYGKPFTNETIEIIMEYMSPSYISGITLLGGDPMEPSNLKALLPLLRRIKETYPNKNIWCFTGCDFEKDIVNRMLETVEGTKEFVSYIDVFVDGEYVEELHNLNLRFRGSSNQRIIDVRKSLETGSVCLSEYHN